MSITFSVAISYNNALGWIDYDADACKAEVHLGDAKGKELTDAYLSTTHPINIPHETLMDFTLETIDPLADEESFKLALTRLWEETQVHVDWSRPVEYVKQHPHY